MPSTWQRVKAKLKGIWPMCLQLRVAVADHSVVGAVDYCRDRWFFGLVMARIDEKRLFLNEF
jgi:hypothetical protein